MCTPGWHALPHEKCPLTKSASHLYVAHPEYSGTGPPIAAFTCIQQGINYFKQACFPVQSRKVVQIPGCQLWCGRHDQKYVVMTQPQGSDPCSFEGSSQPQLKQKVCKKNPPTMGPQFHPTYPHHPSYPEDCACLTVSAICAHKDLAFHDFSATQGDLATWKSKAWMIITPHRLMSLMWTWRHEKYWEGLVTVGNYPTIHWRLSYINAVKQS